MLLIIEHYKYRAFFPMVCRRHRRVVSITKIQHRLQHDDVAWKTKRFTFYSAITNPHQEWQASGRGSNVRANERHETDLAVRHGRWHIQGSSLWKTRHTKGEFGWEQR